MKTEIKATLIILALGILGCNIFFDTPIMDGVKELFAYGFIGFIYFLITWDCKKKSTS